jgi:hypothetical protein
VDKDQTMARFSNSLDPAEQEEMMIHLLDSRPGRRGLVDNMKERGHDENTL